MDFQVAHVSSDVTHILDEVFTLCRIPFVTDFLFTPDPVADISILTAPVQTEHAIAARITISGTKISAHFAHVAEFAVDFAADFYFTSVPAFSIGSVTVGFCTQEPAKDSTQQFINTFQSGIDSVQCNRYVRDDSKGVFLMLSENPVSGLTEIDCMSHRSARRRTRVCARFYTQQFRSNIKTRNGVLHPADIAHSLSYLSVAYERRKCPVCAASDVGECGCVLPFRRPSHPLDFRNERRNMSLHTGKYEGGSNVRLFDAMHPVVVTDLSTKSVIKGSVDKSIIRRMNQCAVQISMAKLSVSPSAMIIPHGVSYLPVSSHSNIRSILQDFCDTPEPLLWDGAFCSETSATKGAVTMNSGLLEFSPETCNSPVSGTRPLSLIGDGSRDYLKEFVDTNTTGRAASRDGLSGVTSPSRAIQKTRSDSDSASKILDEKDLKAELRKQRNREAAAKSNKKRKIRNQALRKDLAEASKRESELRAMEKQLREENVRLRNLANRRKLKISSHLTHIQIANA